MSDETTTFGGKELHRVWIRRAGRVVFGDRLGLALFMGCLCVFGLTWRAGLFITDSEVFVRTLAALADGRLWIEPVTGDHFAGPGTYVNDGYTYGRNYGELILTLPVLWLVEGIDAAADLRVGLTALWHLALLGLLAQVDRLCGWRREATITAAAGVVGLFVINLAMATSFVRVRPAMLALQLGTTVATGLLAVLVYRLVSREQGTRWGLVAGAASVLVLPIGFWAQIPKRHVWTGLVVVALLYAFSRRYTDDRQVGLSPLGSVSGFRAFSYALVGLLAWINAAEAIFVLLALVVVDVPTARDNDIRTLAVLGGIFCLSLVPFFLTNVGVSGHPLRPVETLPQAEGVEPRPGDSLGGGSPGTGMLSDLPGATLIQPLIWVTTIVWDQIVASLARATELEAMVRTYLRSGSLDVVGDGGRPEFRAANLSVIESVPLMGGLMVAIAVGAKTARHRGNSIRDRITSTDGLAVAIVVAYFLLFNQWLPNNTLITVRYLLPAYPPLLYLLVRQAAIRRIWTATSGVALWTYVAGVFLGTQLLLAAVVLAELPVAAAVQVHARLGLVAAALLGVTVVGAHLDDRLQPVAGMALGLAAAAGTAFILLAGLAYFSFIGPHVLPVADAVSDLIGGL